MAHDYYHPPQEPVSQSSIPTSVREYWMRQAIKAPDSPCPYAAFGTVIVNHTSEGKVGKAVCSGANAIGDIGNPTLHGEIVGINNCAKVLANPEGEYKLQWWEALQAYKDLTLYTTAEPCAMCATAVRQAGFKECVFGTSIASLMKFGWPQINLTSQEVFNRSGTLQTRPALFGNVLSGETDELFQWQHLYDSDCPRGCERDESNDDCVHVHTALGYDDNAWRNEL